MRSTFRAPCLTIRAKREVTPEAATTYRVTSTLSKGSLHMKKAKTVWTRPSATLTSTGFEVTMYLGTDRA